MNHNLLLHPKTDNQVKQILQRKPASILLVGVEGSGKESLASLVAAELLAISTDKLAGHGYFLRINPDGESISIDEIRALQQFLKLKVPSHNKSIERVVLIDGVQRMRAEAQNALLKTLEEPPLDTCIILTVTSSDLILPTITSRTEELNILPVSEDQAMDYFAQLGKSSLEISKYYSLSQGQAGLLYSLLFSQEHPLIEKVQLAKTILSEPVGKRLLRVDELSKDKQQVKMLINAFIRISHAAMVVSIRQGKESAILQWRDRQEYLIKSSKMLSQNANIKLFLDNVFINL